jgi:hypothetical protein
MKQWLPAWLVAALGLLLLAGSGCDDKDDAPPPTGDLLKVEHLGDLSPRIVPQLLAAAGVEAPLLLRYQVGVYRILYTTVDVASLSGAYDLAGIVDIMLADPNDEDVVLAAFFVTAYNHIYGWNRLGEMFRDPYAGRVLGLFDGTHSFAEVGAALAPTVGLLLRADFVSRYLRGEEPEVSGAIAENTRLDWTPQTPTRLYHGSADTTVPYVNAVTACTTYTQRGAPDVGLVKLGGLGHESAIAAAIAPTLVWFRSF